MRDLFYIALFYTWGTGPKGIVHVENENSLAQEVLVSMNLADALYHHVRVLDPTQDDSKRFFKPGEKWIFWIDQLCINQDDHSEKSNQVKMMVCPITSYPERVLSVCH